MHSPKFCLQQELLFPTRQECTDIFYSYFVAAKEANLEEINDESRSMIRGDDLREFHRDLPVQPLESAFMGCGEGCVKSA
jgi:hypothetical protein